MKKTYVIIFLISLLIAIIYTTSSPNGFVNQFSNLDGADELISEELLLSKIDTGRNIYKEKCTSCHGKELVGNKFWRTKKDIDGNNLPPPLNGTGHTWHHSPEQLFKIIKYGIKHFDPNYEGNMRGFEELSDDEIHSILEFIMSTWPEEIREQYTEKYQ
jgi:mono/diheme cytochrome c family protein